MSYLLFDSFAFELAPPVGASPGYTRAMLSLLPPGKALPRLLDSLLYQLLEGCADELGRFDARVQNLFTEMNPATAVELLPDYESELDLDTSGTIAEQQGRVVGALVSRRGFKPADVQKALATLLAQAPSSVVVLERTVAIAAAMGDAREVYRFFVYRDPTLPGTYFLASAQVLLDQIKFSHTVGTVIESIDFACDDPHSLCDRDLLGA